MKFRIRSILYFLVMIFFILSFAEYLLLTDKFDDFIESSIFAVSQFFGMWRD